MHADAFRLALPVRLRSRLPDSLQAFKHRSRFAFVQFWYSDAAFHYEVWPQPRYNVIEVGLHFEHRDSVRNFALHRFFDERLIEIRDYAGDMWLEQWDKGWHKLYKTLPLVPYTEALLEIVSEELARQITILEPLLREGLEMISEPARAGPRVRQKR